MLEKVLTLLGSPHCDSMKGELECSTTLVRANRKLIFFATATSAFKTRSRLLNMFVVAHAMSCLTKSDEDTKEYEKGKTDVSL